MSVEMATIGNECSEIPTDWLERCFVEHRKHSGYIPKVSDLLKVWNASLKSEEFEQRAIEAPKAGNGHDCKYCMVVYHRLEIYRGTAGNHSILLDSERKAVGEKPTLGEVKCWINCLSSLSSQQFGIILDYWGDGKNPYGLTSMEIRRGVDTIRSGRVWDGR